MTSPYLQKPSQKIKYDSSSPKQTNSNSSIHNSGSGNRFGVTSFTKDKDSRTNVMNNSIIHNSRLGESTSNTSGKNGSKISIKVSGRLIDGGNHAQSSNNNHFRRVANRANSSDSTNEYPNYQGESPSSGNRFISQQLQTSEAQVLQFVKLLSALSNNETHWSKKLTILQKLHQYVPLIVDIGNNVINVSPSIEIEANLNVSHNSIEEVESSEISEFRQESIQQKVAETSNSISVSNNAGRLILVLSDLLLDLRCSLVKESCELLENIVNAGLKNPTVWELIPTQRLLNLHASPLNAMKNASEKALFAVLSQFMQTRIEFGDTGSQKFFLPFIEFTEKWIRNSRATQDFDIANKLCSLKYLEESIVSQPFRFHWKNQESIHDRVSSILSKGAEDKNNQVAVTSKRLISLFESCCQTKSGISDSLQLSSNNDERGKTNVRLRPKPPTVLELTNITSPSQQNMEESPLVNTGELDSLLASYSSPLTMTSSSQDGIKYSSVDSLRKRINISPTNRISDTSIEPNIFVSESSPLSSKYNQSSRNSQDLTDNHVNTNATKQMNPSFKKQGSKTNLENAAATKYTIHDINTARLEGLKQSECEVAVLASHNNQLEIELYHHKQLIEQMSRAITILDEQLERYEKQSEEDQPAEKDTSQSGFSLKMKELSSKLQSLRLSLDEEVEVRKNATLIVKEKLEAANQEAKRVQVELYNTTKQLADKQNELDKYKIEKESWKEEKTQLENKVGELQNLNKILSRDNKDLLNRLQNLEKEIDSLNMKEFEKKSSNNGQLESDEVIKDERLHSLEKKVDLMRDEIKRKDNQNSELMKMLHEAVKRLEKSEQLKKIKNSTLEDEKPNNNTINKSNDLPSDSTT